MTLTLEGQEALDYLEFLQHKPEIKSVKQEKVHVSPILQHHSDIAEDIQFAETKPRTYPAGIERESVPRPRWSKEDIGILMYRINPLTGAAKSERTLANLIAKIPNRTEAAIRSKVIELGGHIANGAVCKK